MSRWLYSNPDQNTFIDVDVKTDDGVLRFSTPMRAETILSLRLTRNWRHTDGRKNEWAKSVGHTAHRSNGDRRRR